MKLLPILFISGSVLAGNGGVYRPGVINGLLALGAIVKSAYEFFDPVQSLRKENAFKSRIQQIKSLQKGLLQDSIEQEETALELHELLQAPISILGSVKTDEGLPIHDSSFEVLDALSTSFSTPQFWTAPGTPGSDPEPGSGAASSTSSGSPPGGSNITTSQTVRTAPTQELLAFVKGRLLQNGDLETIEKLLQKGADLTARDAEGWTAMHWLLLVSTQSVDQKRLQVEIIKLFLKHNPSVVDLKYPPCLDRRIANMTPLQLLATSKLLTEDYKELMETLIDSGARFDDMHHHNGSLEGGTLLQQTALSLEPGPVAFWVVDLLIRKGADLEKKIPFGLSPNHKGLTPLQALALSAHYRGRKQMISLLLNAGASFSSPAYPENVQLKPYQGMNTISLLADETDLLAIIKQKIQQPEIHKKARQALMDIECSLRSDIIKQESAHFAPIKAGKSIIDDQVKKRSEFNSAVCTAHNQLLLNYHGGISALFQNLERSTAESIKNEERAELKCLKETPEFRLWNQFVQFGREREDLLASFEQGVENLSENVRQFFGRLRAQQEQMRSRQSRERQALIDEEEQRRSSVLDEEDRRRFSHFDALFRMRLAVIQSQEHRQRLGLQNLENARFDVVQASQQDHFERLVFADKSAEILERFKRGKEEIAAREAEVAWNEKLASILAEAEPQERDEFDNGYASSGPVSRPTPCQAPDINLNEETLEAGPQNASSTEKTIIAWHHIYSRHGYQSLAEVQSVFAPRYQTQNELRELIQATLRDGKMRIEHGGQSNGVRHIYEHSFPLDVGFSHRHGTSKLRVVAEVRDSVVFVVSAYPIP